MATSLLSNLLYAGGNSSSNDTDPRDNASSSNMSDDERRQIVSLLQASAKCIEEGTCGPVIYQTMGALHQYTAMSAGLVAQKAAAVPIEQAQRPAFVNNTVLEDFEHEDALAYGWMEELSEDSTDVAWNSVLALLVQKEPDEEPCLWITKEVLATNGSDLEDEVCEVRDETAKSNNRQPSTELETLHSIPLRRRLRSCSYQNFYGDHRLVLELKRFGVNKRKTKSSLKSQQQILLRCPSEACAKDWVDCLTTAKRKKPETTHANIEVEMVDPSPSNEFGESCDDDTSRSRRRLPIVNVIDSEDDDEEDYGIPDQEAAAAEPNLELSPKRLAEKLQETEDRKRAIKVANKEAMALERARQEEQEEKERLELERLEKEHQQRLQEEARQKELKAMQEAERLQQEKQAALKKLQMEALERKEEKEAQRKRLEAIEKNVETIAKATTSSANNPTPKPSTKHKPMTAAEKQQMRMEREIAARKRAEEERRRIEIEYEQQKKERVEQRRRDLEAKRKLAREEQKRKELIRKQKFLESEQRKEAMKASAMKAAPKKVAKGVFTTQKDNASKKSEKGNLWYSLNKHMSAFETADEERKRKEAEKREEERAKAEAEQEEEDPELMRKRIAEEARQRQVQDEVEKRRKEAEEASKQNGSFSQQNGWKKQGSTSPHTASISPTTSQNSHPSSVSPPAPAHHHSASNGNSMPSVPPLRHPHTQSWNKIHQPPYPQQQQQQQSHQQKQYSRPQAPGMGGPYHPSGPTAQPYRQQQQPPTGSAVPPYSQPPRQPQLPTAQQQPQPTSHSAHQRTTTPPQPPSMTQQVSPQEEFTESTLKKNVLLQWGLQPPNMQVLKPVDQLLCSIHTVFPPSFGVPSHEYFSGWKEILRHELVSEAGILQETKLKKSVRKVRFFLHPDKLPHDLTEDQGFLCKLLWDVINDAFEEYKRSQEDLDWM